MFIRILFFFQKCNLFCSRPISINIPEYPKNILENIRINSSDYAKALNKYAWSSYLFERISKMPQVLNKPGLWIWQGCICKGYLEFRIFLILAPDASIMPKYASTCLDVSQYAWTWQNIAECSWRGLRMPE